MKIKATLVKHKQVIVHGHTAMHTVYWVISAVSGHGIGYGILASCLACTTIIMATYGEHE